jgi:hypothetical protein
MKNWLRGAWCFVRGHKVEVGNACPVTGIKLITCNYCGKSNMPKHDAGSSFN